MASYNSKFKTIRVRAEDYAELVKLNEMTQVPIVALVKVAIPQLKERYGVSDGSNK